MSYIFIMQSGCALIKQNKLQLECMQLCGVLKPAAAQTRRLKLIVLGIDVEAMAILVEYSSTEYVTIKCRDPVTINLFYKRAINTSHCDP